MSPRYRVIEVAELGAEIAQRAARPADQACGAGDATTSRAALAGGSAHRTDPK